MHAQHITCPTGIPADQMIVALQRLDDDGKEAILSIIMTAARRAYWIRDAIQEAVAQQVAEQRDLDAWIEREAEKDLARHADSYGMSKVGDGDYWART